jgi:hypothetical protein
MCQVSPFGAFGSVMDDALNIAMDYVMRTGQAVKFQEAQEVVAHDCAWRSESTNRLGLSNLAMPWNRGKITVERLVVLR